jgi:pyrimidine deaminase RibD-like protein
VVKNGQVLSAAHRGELLGNHAEYIALEKKLSDEAVAGSTVYTSLAPCTTRNHPKIPCADRLIERKVARVVIGMLDPDDRISGRGQRKLRKAGIVTDFFPHDLMTEVEELNRDFTRSCELESQGPKHQPPAKVMGVDDPKVAAMLEYKGKAITVMNRPKSGRY